MAVGRRWKWVVAFVGVAVVAYAAAAVLLYTQQDHLIFPGADRPPPATSGPTEPGADQVWITSDDGCRIEAWYRPGSGRTPANPGPAAIYFHGNGDTVDTGWWVAPHYASTGISTLVVEYRGYGRSDGHPSETAIVADSIRFYDWLVARPEVDPKRVIFHGMSLGGGVAVAVAAHRRPAAMVLEATFSSMIALTHRYWMPGFLCRHPFRSDRALSKLDIPIAIFHGRHDATIPISNGRRLHQFAPNSRFTELDCGHHDYHNDWENVRSFLASVGLLPEP